MDNSPIFSNPQKRTEINWGKVILIGGPLFIILSLARSAFVLIQPDERGVVISAFQPQGYRSEPLEPGLHWILPFIESPKVYSVAPQIYVAGPSSNTGDDALLVRTKDEQTLKISVEARYSIDPAKVIVLHINWQNRYEEELVRPLVRGIVRDTASEFTAPEIVGPAKRNMEQIVTMQLAQKFTENGLIPIHFEITDVDLGD